MIDEILLLCLGLMIAFNFGHLFPVRGPRAHEWGGQRPRPTVQGKWGSYLCLTHRED